MDLRGCSAVVTGGSSGLGAATAAHLAGLGAGVTIMDLDEQGGRRVADSLGPPARFVAGDVSVEADWAGCLDRAAELGPLRVLVNCAGIGLPRRVVDRRGAAHPLSDFQRVITVNLVGTFNGLRLGAARMAANPPDADGERGVVVNTASVAAFEGQRGQVSYSASKGAIVAMTLPAARDLRDVGVRVCCIAPGLMDTPLFHTLPEETVTGLLRDAVFPTRLGRAEEFAQLVGQIVTNRYLNAEVIRLDAGIRMGIA